MGVRCASWSAGCSAAAASAELSAAAPSLLPSYSRLLPLPALFLLFPGCPARVEPLLPLWRRSWRITSGRSAELPPLGQAAATAEEQRSGGRRKFIIGRGEWRPCMLV